MSERVWMNGYDCFMQSIDWELRRAGFAGFISQIVLRLEGEVSAAEVRTSLARRTEQFPVLRSRRRRALPFLYPYWSFDPEAESSYPRVVEHTLPGGDSDVRDHLFGKIFNQPLDAKNGELVRFDLVTEPGRTDVVMTWHHPMMDSHGAEKLIALIAQPELDGPEAWRDGENFADSYTQRLLVKQAYKERLAESRRSLENVSACSEPPPVSLYSRRRAESARRQGFRIIQFSPEQTEVITKNASSICGPLRTSDYFLWATFAELDRLHGRLGVATPSYVVTLPVDMRPKGGGALFSTQESTLFYHIGSDVLGDRDKVFEQLRAQTTQAYRNDLLRSFLYGMELSRPFPAWLFMKLSRNAMKGELGSLFFANTGRVPAELTEFLGRKILDFSHIPAVAAPPGIGVFFYRFGDALKCTVVYVQGVIREDDIRFFVEGLQGRLLDPDAEPGGA